MEEKKNEPNIRKFFEALAVIYSERFGVDIRVKEIRRRDAAEEKEHVFE